MKKLFVLITAGLLAGVAAKAQPLHCGSNENRLQLLKRFPQLAEVEAQVERQMKGYAAQGNLSHFAKGTAVNTDSVYHVPLVFHIVHDYGEEYVTDDQIFEVVNDINRMYSRTNTLTSPIVAPYAGNIPGTNIMYRGKANIQFHLATRDPNGNPTRGITRTRSYFANNAGDNSKIGQWAPDSYVNVWLIHTFSGAHASAAAYAIYPSAAELYPYGDGVISIVQPSTGNPLNYDHSISHELGHVMNLIHPFGNNNGTAGAAVGDDEVDDTPPTRLPPGSGCVPINLYDTMGATGYKVTYSPTSLYTLYGHYSFIPSQDSATFHPPLPTPPYANTTNVTIDYPDTVNNQNVMTYSFCSQMFTYGQTQRMRTALTSPTAKRNLLYKPANLVNTGVTDADGNFLPLPSIAPTADYTPSKVFVCADGTTPVNFTNRSWNDTIVAANWTFGNGASTATSNSLTSVGSVTFTTPGWLKSSLTVTGNNNPNTGTAELDSLVYLADPNGVQPNNYLQSFDPNTDLDKWPIFNYYATSGQTNYKWKFNNTTGYTDNSSIEFVNYDPRQYYQESTQTLTPEGTYSDFYSCGFDLGNGNGNNTLSFAYAGAYRTTNPAEMNDQFQVSYSNDCGQSWSTFPNSAGILTKGALGNAGYVSGPFTPYAGQWAWKGIDLSGIGGVIYFRFRYKVGTGNVLTTQLGTGNNFYVDRISVNNFSLGVNPGQLEAQGIVLAPNPTTGASTVVIKGGDNSTALVHVTDVTGKVVFSSNVRLNAIATNVEIPAASIAVKGMYMVEVIANGKPMTQKLVVY